MPILPIVTPDLYLAVAGVFAISILVGKLRSAAERVRRPRMAWNSKALKTQASQRRPKIEKVTRVEE